MSTTITVGLERVVGTSTGHAALSNPHRKMTIMPEGKSVGLVVPYAPRTVTHSALSAEWTEINRSGQQPLLSRSNDPRPKMGFTLFVGSPDPDVSVGKILEALASYARWQTRLRVNYSSWENGLWQISSMSFTSQHRNTQNEITRAEVEIEFILASDVRTRMGPVTGGVAPAPVAAPKPPTAAPKVRWHRTKANDTLHSLAVRYYRDSSKWRRIATANKIRNPRRTKKLGKGRVLRIP